MQIDHLDKEEYTTAKVGRKRAMINYLFINNYKTFVNFKINFDKKSLLIGKNGTGKSSIFSIIASLKAFIIGNGANVGSLFLSGSTTRWMKSNIQTFELGITDGDTQFIYKLEIEHAEQNIQEVFVLSENLTVDGTIVLQVAEGKARVQDGSTSKDYLVDKTLSAVLMVSYDINNKRIRQFISAINKIVFCMPNPKLMVDKVENDVYIPTLDFSNFASVYLGLTMMFPEVSEKVTNSMKESNPNFVRARIIPETYGKSFMLDYRYKDQPVPFRFNELSDGEKMIFVLYTLLYGYVSNGCTLLMDEPDNYVSLREIQPWCMALENEVENQGQCILISHNPEIINYMADTDGVWLSRLSSGESQIIDNPYINAAERNLLPYSELIARGMEDK